MPTVNKVFGDIEPFYYIDKINNIINKYILNIILKVFSKSDFNSY